MQHLAWIVVILWVCCARSCMYTDLKKEVWAGSDVYLPCNFSSCHQTLDHGVSVEWEFDDKVALIFFYNNITVTLWPNLTFTGDVSRGDFSIAMRSVTCNQSGTYICRSRSPLSPLIYKNYTELTVTRSHPGRTSPPDKPQEKTESLSRGLSMLGIFILGWLVGMVLLIAGAVLGVWEWRKRLFRQAALRLDQAESVPGGETCPPHQNQDIYVTLQSCKPPTHHVAKEDNIYMLMRPANTVH